jgi:hypothetical protein
MARKIKRDRSNDQSLELKTLDAEVEDISDPKMCGVQVRKELTDVMRIYAVD